MTGKELRALRLKLDITQAEMGERLGITAGLVCKLEKGAKMNKSVEILARFVASQA